MSSLDAVAGYHIGTVLDHGSLGSRALSQTPTGAEVIIEVISVTAEEELFERALRRIEVMSQHRHENLVPILDAGLHNDTLFIVTPKPDLLASDVGVLGEDAETVAVAAARGLLRLHASGIVHRDIQACHIGWYGGTIKLGGVGLADSPCGERTNGVGPIGAVSTMAPTLVNGAGATVGSDVFSLGATLHLLATGHCVFGEHTESLAQRIVRIATESPQPHPSLPSALLPIVTQMLAVDGQTAEATDLLEAFAQQRPKHPHLDPKDI